jgi:hypothetical protein
MLVLVRVCGGAFFFALALALSMPTGAAATMHTSGTLVEYNDPSPSTMTMAAVKTFLSDTSCAF